MSSTKAEQYNFLKSLLLVCVIVVACLWLFWPAETDVDFIEDFPIESAEQPSQEAITTPPVMTAELTVVNNEDEQVDESLDESASDMNLQLTDDGVQEVAPDNIDPQELTSLLKVDINHMIEQWRDAWQVGDTERYLSFYSEDFTPAGGASLADWRAQRQSRVRPSNRVQLSLSNFDVVLEDDNQKADVSFDQRYESATYQENSRKRLQLVKDQEWRIVGEVSLQ